MIIIFIIVSGLMIWNLRLRFVPTQVNLESYKKPSIAVLPFVNNSDDPNKEYICNGVTEEIINNLARLRDLRVISRTSTFYFKDKNLNIRTIGEKLNVDTVLEGSVRVSGNQLRISAQLIKVADDSHLWAEIYERKMEDLFDTQKNLAQEIACSLESRLGCKGDDIFGKHSTTNLEAYNLYRMGRFYWEKASYPEAIDYFEKAIAVDPNYALAFTGISDSYNYLAFLYGQSVTEYYQKSKAAAIKALKIDDKLAAAYSSLGTLMHRFEWDRTGAAEKAHRRAIALEPGNASVLRYYAEYLVGMGRLDEALAELSKALELDPLSIDVNRVYALYLGWINQFDQSFEQFEKTLALYPDNYFAKRQLANTYMAAKRYEECIALYKEIMSFTGRKNPFALGSLGYAYGMAGKHEEAQKILAESLERSKQGFYPGQAIASIYTGLGNKDMAFKWLERAYEQRDPRLWPIRFVPRYRSLHSDPRWSVLVKKMGPVE